MTDLLEDIEPLKPHPAVDVYVPQAIVLNLGPADTEALRQLSVLMRLDPVTVVHELIRRATPHANGKAGYENVCSSCGRTYTSNRRALPGKRNYCPGCRKSGEPAADRARDYRERKSAQRT